MVKLRLKNFLPRTLYGRAATILLLPIFTLQLAVAVIFIQRHFEDVTLQMTQTIVSEIQFILDELDTRPLADVAAQDAARLNLMLRPWNGKVSGDSRLWYDISGRILIPALYESLPNLRDVDLSNIRDVYVHMESIHGPITMSFSRGRVSASNPHQLLVLMVLTGLFMTAISFFFLRAQLRPIKQLASAASAFGRGQVVPVRPRGAIEVRTACQSFLDMRDRIERQIEQRTMMLSGVSHDLRTPLTRMKLALEMIDGVEGMGLKQDVQDMAEMLDAYLAYARDSASEDYQEVDLVLHMSQLCTRYGDTVEFFHDTDECFMSVRPILVMRAIENLVSNGVRYGTKVQINVFTRPNHVRIVVEDDGPGIPVNDREDALRPFVRLEGGRNQNKVGVGLGLAITSDAVRSHGGTLNLGDSDMGGLKATITFPFDRQKFVSGRPGRT